MTAAPAPGPANLEPVFAALREILEPWLPPNDDRFDCRDEPGEVHLNTRHVMKNGQPLYFGGAVIRKNYVSYYVMPVYVRPELLEGMSDGLRRRMQGKSCFNFKTVDQELFSELAELTRRGLDFYDAEGYV